MAKLKVFAIFDAAAKAYGPPMVFHTTGLALREFETICRNSDSQLYKSPADFSMWEIGEYETDNGEILESPRTKAVVQAIEYSQQGLKAVN